MQLVRISYKYVQEKYWTLLIKINIFQIVKCVKNRSSFFAEQLHKSMKGLGTDDSRLIRLVVTRSEVDMGEIKNVFLQQYGESLEDFISVSYQYKKNYISYIYTEI